MASLQKNLERLLRARERIGITKGSGIAFILGAVAFQDRLQDPWGDWTTCQLIVWMGLGLLVYSRLLERRMIRQIPEIIGASS